MKRWAGAILAAAVCLSLTLSDWVPAVAETAPAATATESVSVPGVSGAAVEPDSYEAYAAAHGDAAAAAQDVSVSCGWSLAADSGARTVTISVPREGLYRLELTYRVSDATPGSLTLAVLVDGALPFSEMAALTFPKFWQDDTAIRTDDNGNEFSPAQHLYEEAVSAYAAPRHEDTPYALFLSAGEHTVTLTAARGTVLLLEALALRAPLQAAEYTKPDASRPTYTGEPLTFEGERALWKNSYWLVPQSDSDSPLVSPADATVSRINYIGGTNWKQAGETITWQIEVPTDGYYALGFAYRQNTVVHYSSYRSIAIDGAVPFAQAERMAFPYTTGWEKRALANESGVPYSLWLTKGIHTVSMTVTLGEYAAVRRRLETVIARLGDIYLEMTMLIGETVDISRDYDLFDSIPELDTSLEWCLEELTDIEQTMRSISGGKGGSYESVVRNMARVLRQMLDNRFSATRYKSNYYTNYSSLSECASEMEDMPLDIDRLILASPTDAQAFSNAYRFGSLLERVTFSAKRFAASFRGDYTRTRQEDDQTVTLWVNWGRDQVKVLNSLIRSDFTEKTGIHVRVQMVNASIVQAILAGAGPDCVLQQSRTEPVNLAMRGALRDLSQFEDCDEVLSRFAPGAATPYYYKGKLYALPDTQTFFMLFYRQDVLEKLNLSVPTTWDEYFEAAKVLAHNNLSVGMPYTQITDNGQTGVGAGALSLLPSLLLQNRISLYTEAEDATTLTGAPVLRVFNEWTDYYTRLKVPISMNFYNRFRSGISPLGISAYTLAVTLESEAAELDGVWGMTAIPGVRQEDGSIRRTSAGGGTGCSILNIAANPDGAWQFLKWWTDADTQAAYSTNLESILGPTARVAVSNRAALDNMAWDADKLEGIRSAWEQVEELPELPGGYQVSRSIDMAFYNVANSNMSGKDMLLKWGKEADEEIARKRAQYENR